MQAPVRKRKRFGRLAARASASEELLERIIRFRLGIFGLALPIPRQAPQTIYLGVEVEVEISPASSFPVAGPPTHSRERFASPISRPSWPTKFDPANPVPLTCSAQAQPFGFSQSAPAP